MRFSFILSGLLVLSGPVSAGPLSKFEDREPVLRTVSPVALHDLERCLIDMDGWPLPMVIRQPDRPDRVTLVYYIQNRTMGRIDLAAVAGGTSVVAWEIGNQGRSCVETGKNSQTEPARK